MNHELKRLRALLILLGFVSFLLLIGNTLARYDDTGPQAALARLQERAAGTLDVHWNERTNVPDFLTGRSATDRIPYAPSAAERGNPAAIARGFLDENRALFKLESAADNLQVLRVESDQQLGYAHVRMNQTYRGIPVFGRQLVVHIDAQEQIVAVNGQFAPEINVATKPSISSADAERVALKDLLESELDDEERANVHSEVLPSNTQLMIYVEPNGHATLSWKVEILTDRPLGAWVYFVNAGRPVVVHHFDSAQHIKQRRTFSADNTTSIPGRILIEEGEVSRTDKVAQAAHDNAGKVYDYYLNTFKRDGIDGQGSPMISTVHYGSDAQDAQNAAWISQRQQMVYGDGGKIFKPLALGLDVVGHEFTHGVTDGTAGLIYQSQSGALNESYSDFFGAMIDRANWTIGEEVIKSPPYPVPYLRNMQDPSAGGLYDPKEPLKSVGQPSHMREYANLPTARKSDNGGVHVNSGIPNRAAFLIAQAIGKEKTEQIYFRTLTQYLTPESDFLDAVRATLRAAQDLYGTTEVTAVRNGFAQVGLSTTTAPSNTPTPIITGTPRPATPTPQRATPTPTTPTTAGCTNLIVNGGFESPNAGWIEVTTAQTSIIDTELPHNGSRSAWLGGSDEEALQYIYQDVRIPANTTSVTLKYWRLVHEEKKSDSATDAKFWTVIARTNGDVLQTVEQLTSSQGDDTWRPGEFDISQFAGKTVRLAYIAENPKENISSYFVDDVELLSCTTGQQSQPTPAGDNVFVQGYIRNADTGRGIEGAQFFILRPGLSATDAADDDTVMQDEVLTSGVSDATGLYQSEAAVPRGKTYSVIVIAKGFRPIVADDALKVTSSAKNPFVINANMRPSR